MAAPYSGAHVSTLKRIRPSIRSTVDESTVLGHLEAHRHPVGELADVGHDGDHPAARAELLDRRRHDVEGAGIERAEALVEEDRLDRSARPRRPARSVASARARASDSDARNVSPPDSVRALRSSSALAWSRTMNSARRARGRTARSTARASRIVAASTSSSSAACISQASKPRPAAGARAARRPGASAVTASTRARSSTRRWRRSSKTAIGGRGVRLGPGQPVPHRRQGSSAPTSPSTAATPRWAAVSDALPLGRGRARRPGASVVPLDPQCGGQLAGPGRQGHPVGGQPGPGERRRTQRPSA